MKRLVAMLLMVIVMVSSLQAVNLPVLASSLSSTSVAAFGQEEALFLSKAGILIGSGGNLMLDQTFTVEQLMTVLSRLAGKEAEAKAYSTKILFSDVPATRWSAPYIAWAKATGLSKGKPDGTIGYADPVTLQRLCAFLLRSLGYPDIAWNDTMSFSRGLGLIKGTEGKPEAVINRDLVALLTYRALFTPMREGILLGKMLGIAGIDVTDGQQELSPAEISAKVGPSVVLIETKDASGQIAGSGSGFVIGTDGRIATNYHVLAGFYSADIKTTDGRVLPVTHVLAYDKERDLAIVQVNVTDLPMVTLGDSSAVVTGQKVLAIGSPKGLENTVSDGLVSNRLRLVNDKSYIQISTPISPGSSGGVLLDYRGQVIGITTAGIPDAQNLNLAVPVNDLKPLMGIWQPITMKELALLPYVGALTYADAVYYGDIQLGVPHGKGTILYDNDDLYDGDWLNGQRTGQGEYFFANGDKYVGAFLNGTCHGIGTYTWANGDWFSGTYVNDSREGYGTLKLADGTVLAGNWHNDAYAEAKSPTGVIATAVSSSEVQVGWNALPAADWYYVYYGTSPAQVTTPFEDAAGNKMKMKWFAGYSTSLTGCDPGTTYYFTVTSVTGGIESLPSPVVSAKTLGAVYVPILTTTLYLYADDRENTYLGKLTTNKYDSESVFNTYGTYGSKYSSTSIWNAYSDYGSKYSSTSAFNDYASNPPLIIDSNGTVLGRLTTNRFKSGAVSPYELMSFIEKYGG